MPSGAAQRVSSTSYYQCLCNSIPPLTKKTSSGTFLNAESASRCQICQSSQRIEQNAPPPAHPEAAAEAAPPPYSRLPGEHDAAHPENSWVSLFSYLFFLALHLPSLTLSLFTEGNKLAGTAKRALPWCSRLLQTRSFGLVARPGGRRARRGSRSKDHARS